MFLLESGDAILLESGHALLLEELLIDYSPFRIVLTQSYSGGPRSTQALSRTLAETTFGYSGGPRGTMVAEPEE